MACFLWECSRLRHGLFTPPEFIPLVSACLREYLTTHKPNAERRKEILTMSTNSIYQTDARSSETHQPQQVQHVADVATGSDHWIPVGEQRPKKGQKVFVCGHWNNGNRWRTIAEWWPAGTMDASNSDDPPEEWWDEDGNECRCP